MEAQLLLFTLRNGVRARGTSNPTEFQCCG